MLDLALLLFNESCADLIGPLVLNRVVLHKASDCFSTVVDLAELDQQRNHVEQVTIFHVVVPRQNRNGLLGLKHVGRGRVVEDHAVLGCSAEFGHVFGKHTVDVSAVLSEQTHRTVSVRVHLIH